MNKIIMGLCMVVAVAACEKTIASEKLKCGDFDIAAKVYQDKIIAFVNGIEIEMPQTVSASGARYTGIVSDTEAVLWNKGADWTLFMGESTFECEKI